MWYGLLVALDGRLSCHFRITSWLFGSVPRERLRFFNIASSTLSETGYALHAARRLGYVSEAMYLELEIRVRAVAAPLNGLIKANKSKQCAAVAGKAGAIGIVLVLFLQWLLSSRRGRTAAPPTSRRKAGESNEASRRRASPTSGASPTKRALACHSHHRRHVSLGGDSSGFLRGIRLAL